MARFDRARAPHCIAKSDNKHMMCACVCVFVQCACAFARLGAHTVPVCAPRSWRRCFLLVCANSFAGRNYKLTRIIKRIARHPTTPPPPETREHDRVVNNLLHPDRRTHTNTHTSLLRHPYDILMVLFFCSKCVTQSLERARARFYCK